MGRVIEQRTRTDTARVVPGPVADALSEAARIRNEAHRRAGDLEAQVVAAADRRARAALAAEYVTLGRMQAAHSQALERQLVALAVQVAGRLLQSDLERKPEAIVPIVRPLLAKLTGATHITLHVHPDDLPAVEMWLHAQHAPEQGITVRGDGEITRGGCVVQSDVGSLDARVETRLDALQAAMTAAPQAKTEGSD